MVKRRLTLLERYRRIKRIIRFLSRRGTLFRKKVPEKKIIYDQHYKSNKKIWRPWRKIRYLMRRGTLFRKKKKAGISYPQLHSFSGSNEKASRFRPYLAYRRLRFVINTGMLFRLRKLERPVKKRKRKTIRKIRFLLKRGTLVRFQSRPIRSFWKNYFRIILKPRYLKIILNSTILFLLAYFVVFLFINLASSISALTYDIQSVIYYFKVEFLIGAKEWKTDAIKVVFSAGPFFSLILALLVLVLYINISEETMYFRLFLFWIFSHAFLHFFGELLIGILLTKGIGLSLAYMFIPEYKVLIIILFSLACLMLTGFLLTKITLFSGNVYFNMITKENRSYFLHSQLLIPFILGFTVLVLIKTPKITAFDILVNLTMLLLILPIVIRGLFMKDLYFDPEPRNINIRVKILLLAGAVLVLFRVIFEAGLRIG